MDIKANKYDVTARENGRWFTVDKETKILVAASGNVNYNRKIKQLASSNGIANIAKELASIEKKMDIDRIETLRLIMAEAAVGTILLDWKGLKEGGEVLEYSPKEAKRLLQDPAYEDFYKLVFDFANEVENFRVLEDEEIKKSHGNSSSSEAKGKEK